jgi:hypothetical protein
LELKSMKDFPQELRINGLYPFSFKSREETGFSWKGAEEEEDSDEGG